MQPSSRPHTPVNLLHRLHRGAGGWRNRIGAGSLLTALLLSVNAHAVALGRVHVWSALGAPLRAEVELSGLGAEEAATLRAEIAPPEAYQEARLEYHPLLSDLRIMLDRRANGSVRVHLSGSHAASMPYLQLLLRISSNEGVVTRNYTLLLDPNAQPAPAAPELAGRPTAGQDVRPASGVPMRQAVTSAAPVTDASPTPRQPARLAPVLAAEPGPVTTQAVEPPAATPAAVPQPASTAPPPPASPTTKRPEAPPSPSTSNWHDVLLQPPWLATAAGTVALLGLLAWVRRRRQASAAEPIEPAATPAEPISGADPFGAVLAAALATSAAAKDTPPLTGELDIDLTALEQEAGHPLPHTDPHEQNLASSGLTGEVPLDFHPTLPAGPDLPDSGRAGISHSDDPVAGQLTQPG